MTDQGSNDRLGKVIPSLVVSPCAEAIGFYERAFGAEEISPRMTGPDGSVGHAEIRIGDSVIMLADEWPAGASLSPRTLGGTTVAFFISTGNVDALWDQALAAGAEVVYPLKMQFYGDKAGRVRDPFGHQWALSEHVEDVSPDEMQRRVATFYEQPGE